MKSIAASVNSSSAVSMRLLVTVAQMIFPELPARIAVGFEERRQRGHLISYPVGGSRHPDGKQAGAERMLPQDESRPSGGTALLGVPVGEKRAFLGHGIDVGCLVAHHSLVVGADVPITDVVSPNDEDVGFVGG